MVEKRDAIMCVINPFQTGLYRRKIFVFNKVFNNKIQLTPAAGVPSVSGVPTTPISLPAPAASTATESSGVARPAPDTKPA